VQNSDFLAVGCGLNECSCFASDFVVLVLSEAVLSEAVLSEAVLVLDGCWNRGDTNRGSRRFVVTCGPMSRIAILDRVEHEHEHEHEKKREQCGAPKSPSMLS
jgi:hypothetical protein